MLELTITREEIASLRRLQEKYRWDGLIPFSVNCHERTWVFGSWGHTPEECRREVGGLSTKLDKIAEEYLRVREDGGRFFIKSGGAYYKNRDKRLTRFVTFPRIKTVLVFDSSGSSA